MYDHLPPASLGMRDVVAAWLVCLAVAAAVFVHPGFSAGPDARTAVVIAASTSSPTELCLIRAKQIAEPHG
jgi:hypothetical protein